MAGQVLTKRVSEPRRMTDGRRLLVTRYRPRGVTKQKETWDEWLKELGPSVELHAAFFGKDGQPPISFDEYRARYLEEMKPQAEKIRALAREVEGGRYLTLLCYCEDASRCHRTLLKGLIDEEVAGLAPREP